MTAAMSVLSGIGLGFALATNPGHHPAIVIGFTALLLGAVIEVAREASRRGLLGTALPCSRRSTSELMKLGVGERLAGFAAVLICAFVLSLLVGTKSWAGVVVVIGCATAVGILGLYALLRIRGR